VVQGRHHGKQLHPYVAWSTAPGRVVAATFLSGLWVFRGFLPKFSISRQGAVRELSHRQLHRQRCFFELFGEYNWRVFAGSTLGAFARYNYLNGRGDIQRTWSQRHKQRDKFSFYRNHVTVGGKVSLDFGLPSNRLQIAHTVLRTPITERWWVFASCHVTVDYRRQEKSMPCRNVNHQSLTTLQKPRIPERIVGLPILTVKATLTCIRGLCCSPGNSLLLQNEGKSSWSTLAIGLLLAERRLPRLATCPNLSLPAGTAMNYSHQP